MGWEGAWDGRVRGMGGCVGWEGVWGGKVCGIGGCVGWEGAWDGRVRGMGGCVGWEGAWDGRVRGMGGCVGWEGVWDGRVCGVGGCVGWEGVWGGRVCVVEGCVGWEGVWGEGCVGWKCVWGGRVFMCATYVSEAWRERVTCDTCVHHSRRVRNLEEEFHRHASPADLQRELNLSERVSSLLYNYWQLKRKVSWPILGSNVHMYSHCQRQLSTKTTSHATFTSLWLTGSHINK